MRGDLQGSSTEDRDRSGTPAALFGRCCALLRRRDPRAAELLPLLEAHAGYALGWLELARTLLDCGRIEAALVAARRSVAADAGEVDAQLLLASVRVQAGQRASAIAGLETAERHAPCMAVLPLQRGLLLRDAGERASAAAALERATALDPRLARAWFALGLVRQDGDDHEGAAASYRAALEAAPELHEAALNLGIALQEARHFEAALDAYAACYRLHPPSFGRIAQALVAAPIGTLWLDLGELRAILIARA